MPKLPSYGVIAVGVNIAEDQDPLQYAERDAQRIFATFTGALGPARMDQSILLLGGQATRRKLINALAAAAELGTDYLLFYFSGHGGQDGICLADGVLTYQTLRRALRRVNSRCTLIVLDSCHAGAYFIETGGLAGLEEHWADVLASATPGTRMFFATSATAYSRESEEVRHGHFTYSLIRALHTGEGNIDRAGYRWISDLEVFRRAQRILRRRWPNDAEPESRKLGGNFPMILSQTDFPIGAGEVELTPSGTPVVGDVTIRVRNRRNVYTRLLCSLHDESGNKLDETKVDLFPERHARTYTRRIAFPLASLMNEAAVAKLAVRRAVRAWWHVRLVDPYHAHILDELQQEVYLRPRPRPPVRT